MGELDARLALSGMRGDAKYSVLCDGDGSGSAAGLGTGSGEARLEALRFAWPGLRYENMFEGAIAGAWVGSSAAIAIAIALLPRGGTDDWRPEAQLLNRTGGGASQRGKAPAETIAECVEGGAGAGAEGQVVQRLAASKSALHTSVVARCWETAGRSLCGAVATRQSQSPKNYRMDAWLELWTRSRRADAFERWTVRAGGVSNFGVEVCTVQVQPSARGPGSVLEFAPTATETTLNTQHLPRPHASSSWMHAGITSRHRHVDLRPEGHTSCQIAPFDSRCAACIVYTSSQLEQRDGNSNGNAATH